ncbi:MAG: hypothetical protein PGN26_08120 [Xylophilus ampelinus]
MPARQFIDNCLVTAAGGQTLNVLAPSDGQPFYTLARGDARNVDQAVPDVHQAPGEAQNGPWGALTAL